MPLPKFDPTGLGAGREDRRDKLLDALFSPHPAACVGFHGATLPSLRIGASRASLSAQLDYVPGLALVAFSHRGGNRRPNAFRGHTKWVGVEVDITSGCDGLRVAQQLPDDWRAQAAASPKAGEGMTQIVNAHAIKLSFPSHHRPWSFEIGARRDRIIASNDIHSYAIKSPFEIDLVPFQVQNFAQATAGDSFDYEEWRLFGDETFSPSAGSVN
jgi:hypothetical protein